MEDTRFLYSVNPKRVIKSSNPELAKIRTSKSLLLTKDEVKELLKFATIYRRFSVSHSEKVSIMNIDRLHNSVFIEGHEREIKPEVTKPIYQNPIDNEESDIPAEISSTEVRDLIEESDLLSIKHDNTVIVEETPIEEDLDEIIEDTSISIVADAEENAQEIIDVVEDTLSEEDTDNKIIEEIKEEKNEKYYSQNYTKNKKRHHH